MAHGLPSPHHAAAPALLPPEAARPLRTWDRAQRSGLAASVEQLLRDWEAAYGLESPEGGAVRCEAAPELLQDAGWAGWRWTPLSQAVGAWWTLLSEFRGAGAMPAPVMDATWGPWDPLATLHAVLFEESTPRGEGLADEVARGAWEDWCGRLAGLLASGAGSVEMAHGTLKPWSGSLALTIPWCGRTLLVVLDGDRAAACLGPRPERPAVEAGPRAPLVPVLQAAGALPLTLRVEMLPTEIDLGTLGTLRVGDVLRTSHALEAPLRVVGSGDAEGLCHAFLGRQGDRRAVELLARPGRPPAKAR